MNSGRLSKCYVVNRAVRPLIFVPTHFASIVAPSQSVRGRSSSELTFSNSWQFLGTAAEAIKKKKKNDSHHWRFSSTARLFVLGAMSYIGDQSEFTSRCPPLALTLSSYLRVASTVFVGALASV